MYTFILSDGDDDRSLSGRLYNNSVFDYTVIHTKSGLVL